MEIGQLAAAVGQELGCRVIGGTTSGGAVLTNEGYHELAVILQVITDDDCLFAAAISGSLETNPEKEIRDTYQEAYKNLKEQNGDAEPALIICVTSMVQSCSTDLGLDVLSGESGNLPVFGYVAADDFEMCKQQVYLDGEIGGDRMALLLLAGNIKPVFHVVNLAGKQKLDKKHVTKAHGSVICEIDGRPAYEYIKDFPFIADETNILINYQFFVETKNTPDDDGFPFSRALGACNKETGEIICHADVPQDSYIGLMYCDGNDVDATTRAGMIEFADKIHAAAAGGDYDYSTALVASCSLRNIFLTERKDVEGNLVRDLLPQGLTASGVYAFGEIAPTSTRGAKATNRFHNATFIMCAF
jgi:hypothetical protein